MGGPVCTSDVSITMAGLTRVLSYEPRDLTISVEAGLPWRELTKMLADRQQMVPLDPPFGDTATVGGVIASNCSGPRRRLYGTARDLVIGMKFATLEGRIVQSGGMVVKNVAGLDMGKLLIGSFGTLAAIAVVNFKLQPVPQVERHFLLTYRDLAEAFSAATKIRQSVLQPASLDVLNAGAAEIAGLQGIVLSVQAGGNNAVIERYQRELAALGSLKVAEPELGLRMAEFTPGFLAANPEGAVVRLSTTLAALPSLPIPAIVRAGSGVAYAYFRDADEAAQFVREHSDAIMEFSPLVHKNSLDLWPTPSQDLEIMKRVKELFDPRHLLNRGRLYRHL